MKTKEDELVKFELNNLKMAESDAAIERRIKAIYHKGILQGWKECREEAKGWKERRERSKHGGDK